MCCAGYWPITVQSHPSDFPSLILIHRWSIKAYRGWITCTRSCIQYMTERISPSNQIDRCYLLYIFLFLTKGPHASLRTRKASVLWTLIDLWLLYSRAQPVPKRCSISVCGMTSEWVNEWMNEISELSGDLHLFLAHCCSLWRQPLLCLTYRPLGPVSAVEFLYHPPVPGAASLVWFWDFCFITGVLKSSSCLRHSLCSLSFQQAGFLWQMLSSCLPTRKVPWGNLFCSL